MRVVSPCCSNFVCHAEVIGIELLQPIDEFIMVKAAELRIVDGQ